MSTSRGQKQRALISGATKKAAHRSARSMSLVMSISRTYPPMQPTDFSISDPTAEKGKP